MTSTGTTEHTHIAVNLEAVDLRAYPLLQEAVKNLRPAINTKIEWLLPEKSISGPMKTVFNYCQIVRTPFVDTGEFSRGLALSDHLRGIETILWDGVREREGWRSSCGGVLDLIGRPPVKGDRVSLRPLRTTTLRKVGDESWEFLSEFSLQVDPVPSLV